MTLFVIHDNTRELCPTGFSHPDKEWVMKVEEKAKNSGIHLIEAYLDGPGHHFYFVAEADKIEQLYTFITPLMTQIGESRIVPVLRWAEARAVAQKLGVQK